MVLKYKWSFVFCSPTDCKMNYEQEYIGSKSALDLTSISIYEELGLYAHRMVEQEWSASLTTSPKSENWQDYSFHLE